MCDPKKKVVVNHSDKTYKHIYAVVLSLFDPTMKEKILNYKEYHKVNHIWDSLSVLKIIKQLI